MTRRLFFAAATALGIAAFFFRPKKRLTANLGELPSSFDQEYR